jgi:hypothetical protein
MITSRFQPQFARMEELIHALEDDPGRDIGMMRPHWSSLFPIPPTRWRRCSDQLDREEETGLEAG